MALTARGRTAVLRGLFGNGFHAMASTTLSGLANVAVQLVVAAVLSPAAFGRFALASATILFAVGGSRMIVGQTDILRGSSGRDPGAINAAYVMAGAALGMGMLLMLAASGDPSSTMFTIGLATAASSVFVVQDSARYRAFKELRASVALTSDVIVLVAAVPGLYLLSVSTGDLANIAILVWTASTALGCIPALIALRYLPSQPRRRWLHAHRDLVRPGGVEYLLQTGMPYLANWLIVLVAGYEGLAGYRLVQLIFAAVSNIAVGLQAATLPGIVATPDAVQARSIIARQRLLLIGIAAAATAALALLPPQVGTAVFDETWTLTAAFIAPVALHGMTNALSVMNFAILRHLGRSRYLLTVRTWSVVASSVGVLVGALMLGAVGAAWAMAVVATAAYGARLVVERRELVRWDRQPVASVTTQQPHVSEKA